MPAKRTRIFQCLLAVFSAWDRDSAFSHDPVQCYLTGRFSAMLLTDLMCKRISGFILFRYFAVSMTTDAGRNVFDYTPESLSSGWAMQVMSVWQL
jgi:hypothetical protein